MSKRDAFLQTVSKDTVNEFLSFIKLHKEDSDPFDINELLQELPRKQKTELWERLRKLLTDVLVENPVETWLQLDDDSDDDMEVENSPNVKMTMAVLGAVANLVAASVSVVDQDIAYGSLLECAVVLSGVLHALPKSEAVLPAAILRLCETWWDKGLEGKEELGKSAFAILMKKSLSDKNTAKDIIRLWHLHQVLLHFDYNSQDSDSIKDLLLQCFMNINYIKKEEGRRFLSFLFSWNIHFIKMIHDTIKNQMLCFPKSLMAHIAEIYFRAWKKASGSVLQTIETSCIQDFMHHGVHLPRNSPVHPKVRELLSYFHQQKLRQGVEEMLYTLYQPILWRSLKARNSDVRANAALLFVEAFPLRDPSLDTEEMDNEIQRQFEELFSLLEDPQPLVRSTAILGVCRITARYWEMIPVTILTDLLNKVLGDLASDTSSADVRCSVFKCLPVILDNKLSHPLLEKLLPTLRNSLHDNSEKVRVAFIDMLLKVKAGRAAKFWKICPMEHLLARLEIDSRPVARRIVNLLFNSFFPVNLPEEVWCERCVTLIQMNAMAARKFYQYAYEHTAPTNIAKLMLTIRRCLNACIQKLIREEGGDDEEENNKENSSVLDEVLSAHDASTMASLLEIVVILWKSISKALDQNEEASDYTISKFASVLPEYLRIFKDERCVVPLIIMASFMPASSIPTFSCGVVSKLRNFDDGAGESKYSTLIDCLCKWGQVGHILELIIDWLSDAVPQNQSKRDSARHVRIQENMESKPELALDYLEYILEHTMNRDYLLTVSHKKLSQLLKLLGSVKDELYLFIKIPDRQPQKIKHDTALRAFCLHCRLCVHLQHKFCDGERTYLVVLECSGTWLDEKVLPFLQAALDEEQVSEQSWNFAKQLIEMYLMVCKDVLIIGLADSEFQEQLLDLALAVMQTDRGFFCLPLLVSILKEVTDICLTQLFEHTGEELVALLEVVQNVFQKALETVARRLKKQREDALQIIYTIEPPLGEFLNTVQCWHAACPEVHRGVLSTILAAVVVEISHCLQKVSNVEDFVVPETLADLPPLSTCLLQVVQKSPNMTSAFFIELVECIDSKTVEGIFGLTATIHILKVLGKGNFKGAVLKEAAATIQSHLQSGREVAFQDDLKRFFYESSDKLLDEVLQS
ncbi:condensin-2 complex subunit G2 isoform X2 [Protopterus annectens]|uniref:condensin-2 complex subunit G2 isoform X2 n=1 Tax=Protopterus annectens TaxID=7888 RepID=UPI001CFBDED4|nr:condensin-2 complex subunit G2 isoform X2 [Protopterus annectens]